MIEKPIHLLSLDNIEIRSLQEKHYQNLLLVQYLLSTNEVYYAVFPEVNTLLEVLKNFQTLPNLQLSAREIKTTAEIVLKNCQIYYQLKEYVRYATFQKLAVDYLMPSLQAMYENIKVQLGFLADLSVVLNGGKSDKFPNVLYQDIPIEQFYIALKDDSLLSRQHDVILHVLLTEHATEITTQTIIKTLYDPLIIQELYQLQSLKTNFQKQMEYIEKRKQHLNTILSNEELVPFQRDDDYLYQEINFVFDVHEAAAISDRIYRKGQGAFAISDYLLTGNLNRFTSKEKARSLVENVNRNIYQQAFLCNVLYRMLLSYQIPNEQEKVLFATLTKLFMESQDDSSVLVSKLVKTMADNLLLLTLAIDYFRYDLLNHEHSDVLLAKDILYRLQDEHLKQTIMHVFQQMNITL